MRLTGSILAVLVLMSCAVLVEAQEIRNLSTDQRVLAGTEWQLVSIGPAGAEANVIPGTTVTLKFGEENRASGSTGCNSYSGSYSAVGDTISIGRLISTKRACLDQRANQQEQRFLAGLEAATKFRLSSNRLTLLSERGRNVLNFVNNAASESGDERAEDRNDPIAALSSYYTAINERDYRRAYRYWESPTTSFERFVSGFADTDRVHLLVDPSARIDGAAGSAYAEISTLVVSTTRAGSDRVFAGCYTLRRSNVQDRGWRIYRATLSPVPSNTPISRMLSQVCK